MPATLPQNPELFLTIETLDEAIDAKRKVAFRYLEYGTDGKQCPKRREDGTVREYITSPYQMAAKEGKYYLICNYDKYDDVSNYRIDRMADVRVLDDEPVKPFDVLILEPKCLADQVRAEAERTLAAYKELEG